MPPTTNDTPVVRPPITRSVLVDRIRAALPPIPSVDPIVALPPHVLADAAQLAADVGNHHLAGLLRDAKVVHPAVVARRHAEAAADTALQAFADGIARADLDRWAPPPRPQLMLDLHAWIDPSVSHELYRQHWTYPGQLAERLRTFADHLDAVAHNACLLADHQLAEDLDAA